MADQNFMKRIAPFLVLEVLKHHTDDAHGLQLVRILELLQEDYGITMERKAVSRILNDLYELTEISQAYSWKHPMPYTIKFDTRPRSTGDIRENWRIYKEFEDVELRLLSDTVQTVRGYPTGRILEKLRQMGGPSQQTATGGENTMMPYIMDTVGKAIHAEKKVAFTHQEGESHTVSPFRMVLQGGIYYLICYDEDRGEMAVFPIDRMRDARMLALTAKDYHMVKGAAQWQYDLERYLEQQMM